MSCELTLERATAVLNKFGNGTLHSGSHKTVEGETCEMCVRELRYLACMVDNWNDLDALSLDTLLPMHILSDTPDSNNTTSATSATDIACHRLNDINWPTDAHRSLYCVPLALLTEAKAPAGWTAKYAELTIRYVVPIALRAAASIHPEQEHKDALELVAKGCENNAAAYAAAYAARAATYAAADAATYAATYAARSAAAYAAAADAAADAAYAAADAATYAAADAATYAATYAARSAARSAARAAAYAAQITPMIASVTCLLIAHGREDLISWDHNCKGFH